MSDKPDFLSAISAHDKAVAQAGLEIWLGAEPTYTDRMSEAPEWLYRAEGGEKSQRALGMLKWFCQQRHNPLILRTIGRQYSGEKLPRWNYGVYESRAGQVIWFGPPDPILGGEAAREREIYGFPLHLQTCFDAHGWKSVCFQIADPLGWRIVFRIDGNQPPAWELDERLFRSSIHTGPIPEEGLSDCLAMEGHYVLIFGNRNDTEALNPDVPSLELPAFPTVSVFIECLGIIGRAAQEFGLSGLILEGYPPPVDASVAWTTFTPDPAVIEVNMAPAKDVCEFYDAVLGIYASANSEGLSPYRFYYNGDATDSGGGGQITFGGSSAERSPFFVKPWLLPNVVRYFNRHPALSYLFTPSCVGSSSQSPRPDECFRETFEEMSLALELLSQQSHSSPEVIWGSLNPFLSDPSGNNHRSEINVEKLWNPLLTGRGCLGLVEFRAFRMAQTAEILTARAVLFRAVLAMLAKSPDLSPLSDWGAELHDRYALPYYLKRDLTEVFGHLTEAGFGLPNTISNLLLDDSDRLLGQVDLNECQLTVQRALEFWPLVGDVASQESGNSRLIDSSTSRIQMILRPTSGSSQDMSQWRVSYRNWNVPVRCETDEAGPLLIFAFKYRSFAPWRGLHPTLQPQTPVELTLQNIASKEAWKLVLHEWNPQRLPYEHLPLDWAESLSRRSERLVLEKVQPDSSSCLEEPPAMSIMPHCLDLRAYGL